MTAGSDPLAYRRLRAPREHGAALIEPALGEVPALLATNLGQRQKFGYDLQGRSLAALATAGRQELVTAAQRYTSTYRNIKEPIDCELEREPSNLYDANAIRVYVNDDRLKRYFKEVYFHIGFLRREVAGVLAQGFDRGTLEVESCRLTYINSRHGWGRLKVLFLKTPASKRKIHP